MKKTMTMAAIALAVSAMAGSAFASSETVQTIASPVFNLVEFAKEKGITIKELIDQMEDIPNEVTVEIQFDEKGNPVITPQK
jgi:ABC-type glycerol-3-phosphate transport system substrate-binding protein